MPGDHAIVATGQRSTLAGVGRSWLTRTIRNLALQDHVLLLYHAYMWLLASLLAVGPLARGAYRDMSLLLAAEIVLLLLTRGELLPAGPLRALAYRLGMLVITSASYFALRPLLHALEPRVLDAQLLAIDRALFGRSPAEWLDALVNPLSVEWFSFFYYSYYALLALILVGSLLFDSGRRRYEVLLAAAIVIAVGHVGYTWVPGVGPYGWHELSFEHALVGGHWWRSVEETVSAAGAELDIFPSLHTGLSLCVGLHVLRYRKQRPFSVVWPLTTFFVANIVVATVFLRWHYGVDLIAGGLLAVFAQRVAIAAWRLEAERGRHDAKQLVWERLAPRGLDPQGVRVVACLLVIHVAVLVAGFLASRAPTHVRSNRGGGIEPQ